MSSRLPPNACEARKISWPNRNVRPAWAVVKPMISAIVRRIGRIARNPDAGAAQAVLVEDVRIVGGTVQVARRLVLRIDRRQDVEQDRGIPHRAGQWAGGVLAVGDRDDAGAADQPDR